jgi:hypothetical protein
MATAQEVAQWMVEKIHKDGVLYQDEAATAIADKFGEKFTYINDNGNVAISRAVLKEFRKLTEKYVVWERGERMWRERGIFDEKGKRQAD